jgi:hypothetical protein
MKPEPWPTDDDKIEHEFAEQEKAKAEAAEAERRKPAGRRKGRKPDPS